MSKWVSLLVAGFITVSSFGVSLLTLVSKEPFQRSYFIIWAMTLMSAWWLTKVIQAPSDREAQALPVPIQRETKTSFGQDFKMLALVLAALLWAYSCLGLVLWLTGSNGIPVWPSLWFTAGIPAAILWARNATKIAQQNDGMEQKIDATPSHPESTSIVQPHHTEGASDGVGKTSHTHASNENTPADAAVPSKQHSLRSPTEIGRSSPTTFRAQCYLAAWDAGVTLESGLAHGERLKEFNLDYSRDSLDRVDAFLDELRTRFAPQYETFLNSTANTNLLYLLAFYVGEVRARMAGQQALWGDWDDLVITVPGIEAFGKGFHNTIAQMQPGVFLPLTSITFRLFDGSEGKSVRYSADAHFDLRKDIPIPGDLPLPPFPPQTLVPNFPSEFALLDEVRREKYLAPYRPHWFDHDPLGRWYEDLPTLLAKGRMVWASVVQANEGLWDGTVRGAPFDVLYDPRGMVAPDILHALAHSLASLKGQRTANPDLQVYADRLQNERLRLFGWRTPSSWVPYPLMTSTTYVDVNILLGKRLAWTMFPIIVCDECPGNVIIAPWELWPKDFYARWVKTLQEETTAE